MPIANRILLAILIWQALVIATLPLRAQDMPPDNSAITLKLSEKERGLILDMCENASWAAKRRYDGICEFWQRKFEAAKPKTEPAPSKPDNE